MPTLRESMASGEIPSGGAVRSAFVVQRRFAEACGSLGRGRGGIAWAGLLVAFTAAIVSMSGSGAEVPLDTHDAYVARTAQVMLDQQEWLVPRINGEPRLNKPPLNYWLVMVSDSLLPGQVTPFEARLPSILAGVGLAMLAWGMGTRFFGWAEGLTAGLATAGCSGLFAYSHSVRPEMVYAALSATSLLIFLHADQRLAEERPGPARAWAYAGWLMAGLATLSKGPQLPLIMVLGLWIGLARTRSWGRAVRVLRPAAGLVLFLLPWAWWYALIYLEVGRAGASWASEVGERWVWSEAWKLLNPYYLYRTMGLLLPWVALYPLMFLAPWMKDLHRRWRAPAARLWWVVIVAMAALSLATHRRWYYMLPLLPVMGTLMAVAALAFLEELGPRGRRVWSLAAAAHAVLLMGGVIFFSFSERLTQRPPVIGLAVAGVGAAGLLAVATWDWRRASRFSGRATLAATLLFGAVFLTVIGVDGSSWGPDRFERGRFARGVAATVEPGEAIFGVEPIWEVEQYYLDRDIPTLETPLDPGAVESGDWLVVRAQYASPALRALPHRVVMSQPVGDTPEDQVRHELWRVERPADSAGPLDPSVSRRGSSREARRRTRGPGSLGFNP